MKAVFILGSYIVGIGVLLACTNTSSNNASDVHTLTLNNNNQISIIDSVAKGKYLVTIMGCNDCHSPKIMTDKGPALDEKRLLSGYDKSRPFDGYDSKTASSGMFAVMNAENTAYAGPWGVSYAANLTSDASGIGNWSLDQFKKALKEGKYKGMEGGRMLLPPMPWQNLINISDEDIACMFAYLQSTTPVENVVPAPIPPVQ